MIEGDRVVGVEARPTSDDRVVHGPEREDRRRPHVVAAGPPGHGSPGCSERPGSRVRPFGLAIRTYAETPRHGDEHLEAMLSLKDENGTAVPGYGWMFPAGDGTVNIGVGALSTMKGFKKLNLNTHDRVVSPRGRTDLGARPEPRAAAGVAAADVDAEAQSDRAGWRSAMPPASSTR